MKYNIADEIVAYETDLENIERRFAHYMINSESKTKKKLLINMNGADIFKIKHNELSAEQSELIYSMQRFFCGLIKCQKLLIHASAVVIGGACYLFIGYPDSGKSYIAIKLTELYDDAYILSDDRTVIGRKKIFCMRGVRHGAKSGGISRTVSV